MTLDERLESQPAPARAAHQLTSNQFMRAVITFALLCLIAYDFIRWSTVDANLLGIFSALVGFYFGEMSPAPDE